MSKLICGSWLGVLIYWLFLFIVVVVLLNILIAQFSKSYEEESERAQINVILTRTEIILKMEQSAITRPCVRVCLLAMVLAYFSQLEFIILIPIHTIFHKIKRAEIDATSLLYYLVKEKTTSVYNIVKGRMAGPNMLMF